MCCILLTLRHCTLYIRNVQFDAQNAACCLIISALMQLPFKVQSSVDLYGNLILAPKSYYVLRYGFLSCVAKDSGLLGCCTVLTGKYLLIYQRIVVPWSSGSSIPILVMFTHWQPTIPEDFSLWQQRCNRCHKLVFFKLYKTFGFE
jgi:hypothetical protein